MNEYFSLEAGTAFGLIAFGGTILYMKRSKLEPEPPTYPDPNRKQIEISSIDTLLLWKALRFRREQTTDEGERYELSNLLRKLGAEEEEEVRKSS